MAEKKTTEQKVRRLEQQYAQYFGCPVRRSSNLSAGGDFVPPTTFKPAVITYTAGTAR